jgi:hypothetical protein
MEQDFLDLDRIPVSLTYRFTDPPTVITFFCRLALSADDNKARAAYYDQPKADQERGQHAYYVDLLCRITAAAPTGLPGFDEALENDEKESEGPSSLADVQRLLKSYLSDPTPVKKKIAEDAIEAYNRITQPAEFFR